MPIGAVGADGAIDDCAASRTTDCNSWVSSKNHPTAANCMYLIRAEERFGNGDGTSTPSKSRADAINALYDAGRGEQEQTAPGRRARLGFEINF